MRKSEPDTGSNDMPETDEPEDEPVEGDQVIELVGGRPFIYEQNQDNERRMARIRGAG